MKRFVFCILLVLFVLGCNTKKMSLKTVSPKTESTASFQNNTLIRITGHWFGEEKKELLVREAVREFLHLNQEYDINLEFSHQIFKDIDESQFFFC